MVTIQTITKMTTKNDSNNDNDDIEQYNNDHTGDNDTLYPQSVWVFVIIVKSA